MTTETNSLKVQCKVHFQQKRHGRKQMTIGEAPTPSPVPFGRIPRISRLMALAIRFNGLLEAGEVADYAQLAQLGHVTRARVTQIMNLMNLAPDIQESILFLPAIEGGRDAIKEWQVRPIAATPDWRVQRSMWNFLGFKFNKHADCIDGHSP